MINNDIINNMYLIHIRFINIYVTKLKNNSIINDACIVDIWVTRLVNIDIISNTFIVNNKLANI